MRVRSPRRVIWATVAGLAAAAAAWILLRRVTICNRDSDTLAAVVVDGHTRHVLAVPRAGAQETHWVVGLTGGRVDVHALYRDRGERVAPCGYDVIGWARALTVVVSTGGVECEGL